MTLHLLLKFRHHWATEGEGGGVDVMTTHMEIAEKFGSCWWGRTSAISLARAEQLRAQIDSGVETFIFLYSIFVPRDVHPDRTLWYVARLKDISLERPRDVERIPSYYRDLNLDCYFSVSDVKAFAFAAGSTPKVPGQAAVRYLSLDGLPVPKNIRFDSDERRSAERIVATNDSADGHSPAPEDADELKNRIIDLQADVIRLQEDGTDLRTYKDRYQKILGTDFLFSSEKFFESWLQENMHRILPELDVIDRQPQARWADGKFGRLDLLAVHKESKGLCIIEVKTRKRSKHSGYDQFVRYISWASRSIDQLAETYSAHGLRPSERPSFIIITDYINDEMTAICEDHGITLIHVFGGLGFEKIC